MDRNVTGTAPNIYHLSTSACTTQHTTSPSLLRSPVNRATFPLGGASRMGPKFVPLLAQCTHTLPPLPLLPLPLLVALPPASPPPLPLPPPPTPLPSLPLPVLPLLLLPSP